MSYDFADLARGARRGRGGVEHRHELPVRGTSGPFGGESAGHIWLTIQQKTDVETPFGIKKRFRLPFSALSAPPAERLSAPKKPSSLTTRCFPRQTATENLV